MLCDVCELWCRFLIMSSEPGLCVCTETVCRQLPNMKCRVCVQDPCVLSMCVCVYMCNV